MSKYELISAREIYNTDYPPIDFLVEGMIPKKGLTILAGAYKSGKSWLILHLCMCLSLGSIFLGKIPVKQIKGVYLALEDSYARLNTRMRMIGFEPSDDLLATIKFDSGKQAFTEISKMLEHDSNLGYVAIDTMAKVTKGSGNNGYQEDYDHIGHIKELADKYGIAIILVTHTRKMSDELDVFNEIIGSTAKMAVADSLLLLKKKRHSADAVLSCSGRDFPEEKYEICFEEYTWVMKGKHEEYRLTPERKEILEELILQGESSARDIAEIIGKNPKAVSAILSKLKDDGFVCDGSSFGMWVAK